MTRPALTVRLCILMFLQFFVWGAWYVSMTGWMKDAGLDGLTAWAYSVGPIAAIISPFFLGMVADRFFATQRVLGALHLFGGIALIAIPHAVRGFPASADDNFFHPLVLLILAHMLCYMPTLGLSSSLSFHHMANTEKQFPVVRVFGTIGWIAGNWAVSLLPEGDRSVEQWYVAGGAGVLLALFSLTLPDTPPPQKGQPFSLRQTLGLDALKLLTRPSYFIFILCSLLICIPLAGYYAQARNFAEFVGFKSPTAVMSLGQASEIFFMLIMPLCFARLGIKWMLAAGMFAWGVRYGLFAGAAEDRVLWMTLVGIALHGICYDFFFVAGQIYVDRTAPHHIRAQAQGFLVLVTQGVGMFLGARAFGALTTRFAGAGGDGPPDWAMIWAIPGAAAVVITLGFVATFRESSRKEAAGSVGDR